MTFERKFVVGLEDIASISLECTSCHRRMTFGPDDRVPVPHNGPCGHEWIPHAVPGAVSVNSMESPLGIFLRVVERIRAISATNPYGVRILLEYPDPS